MNADVLALGVLIGLIIAAPVGPVNLIVIRGVLRQGFWGGVLAGSGAVVGDGILAAVAAFGVRSLTHFILDYAFALKLFGGLFLVAFGVRTARLHAPDSSLQPNVLPFSGRRAGRRAMSTLALTVANPASLLGAIAIFGGLSGFLRLSAGPLRTGLAVAGTMLGSILWWFALSGLVARLKDRLTVAMLDRINRWSGILIAAFGFFILFQAFGI